MALPIFSRNWKSSTQPRKQHKYHHNAPLHIRRSFLHVHLSPALRQKYHTRNVLIRKGDNVKIVRGQFTGKSGIVEKVLLKKGRIMVTGVSLVKRDGAKISAPLTASHLQIMELDLGDRYRKEKLEMLAQRPSSSSMIPPKMISFPTKKQ